MRINKLLNGALARRSRHMCSISRWATQEALKLKQKIVFSTKIYYIFRPGEHLEYSSPKRFRHYLVEKVERRMTRPMKPLTEPQTINNFFEAFALPAEAQASGWRKLAMIINTKRMDTDINSSARHSSKKARGKPRYHRTTKERKKENEINRRRENQKKLLARATQGCEIWAYRLIRTDIAVIREISGSSSVWVLLNLRNIWRSEFSTLVEIV